MRPNSVIKRGLAVLLLLVFFQQMGAGLFVHNLLHDNATTGQSPVKKNEGDKELSFACSCVDNFVMPFVEADSPAITKVVAIHPAPVNGFIEQPCHVSLFFPSLRGPPAYIG